MCSGVALPADALPAGLIDEAGLGGAVHERAGAREVRFLYRVARPRLPVRHEGRIVLAAWGNKCRRGSARLPPTGWTWRATVEGGGWLPWSPEPVVIPAAFALENGVWFPVRRGLRGVLVRDEQGGPVVYVVLQPATRYHGVLTDSSRMPVSVGDDDDIRVEMSAES